MTLPSPAPGLAPHTAPVTLSVAHCLAEIDLDRAQRARTTYIVVDLIRATTTLTVMFGQGARRVLVARTVEMARAVRASLPQALIAGEVNAVAPPDFDHGNSPEEWGTLDLTGRTILFSTTNGARGLHAAMGGGPVFAGSLRNASAVCAAALSCARQLATSQAASQVSVVCCGLREQPADDDSLCAGWLTETLQREAAQSGAAVTLGPGAQKALDLLAAARRAANGGADPRTWLARALAETPAARAVREVGLEADLAWCVDVDASTTVPMVAGEDVARALVIVEQAPADIAHSHLPLGEEIS